MDYEEWVILAAAVMGAFFGAVLAVLVILYRGIL
jgi:hypothetical protein